MRKKIKVVYVALFKVSFPIWSFIRDSFCFIILYEIGYPD